MSKAAEIDTARKEDDNVVGDLIGDVDEVEVVRPRIGRPPGKTFQEKMGFPITSELKDAVHIVAHRRGQAISTVARDALTDYVIAFLGEDWMEEVEVHRAKATR